MKKIVIVTGVRPNIVKAWAVYERIKSLKEISLILVHTNQHSQGKMSYDLFDELKFKPDVILSIDSSKDIKGEVEEKFDAFLKKERPDLVVVFGDVTSTLACALVTKKNNIKLAHVEAGLRSFDNTMPEEHNRIETDKISDYLFVTEESALNNLAKEGIKSSKMFFVGNVMIDALLKNLRRANKLETHKVFNLLSKKYVLLTLHRPPNVDNKERLRDILLSLDKLNYPIIFPVHPRTGKNLTGQTFKNIILAGPQSYLNFVSLMNNSKLVITDSGGIQEETTVLDIPCLTFRESTERPITIASGTNTLCPTIQELTIESRKIIAGKYMKGSDIPYWDGKAAERIVKILSRGVIS